MRDRAGMLTFAALAAVLLLGCDNTAVPATAVVATPPVASTAAPTTVATATLPVPTVPPAAVAAATPLAPIPTPSPVRAPTLPPDPSFLATLPPTVRCTQGSCGGTRLFVAQFFAAAINDEDLSPFLSQGSAIPRRGSDLVTHLALAAPITAVSVRCNVQGGRPDGSGIEWVYVVFATVTTVSGDKNVGVQMDTSQAQLRILTTNPPSSFPLPVAGGPC